MVNAAAVLRELNPDLIAMQEITSQNQLQELANRLEDDYIVLFAPHISQTQRMAYLLRSRAFELLQETFWSTSEGMVSADFAGRLPYVLRLNYSNPSGTYR
ncbi:hypothetical protein RZS08_51380, partial [Arthrospira platensis SPKY1]|nr:hypothetical protein [Arthrospira platensis SPKY1]